MKLKIRILGNLRFYDKMDKKDERMQETMK